MTSQAVDSLLDWIGNPTAFPAGIPHELFERARADQPVFVVPSSPLPPTVHVLAYDCVEAALRDHVTFSSHLGGTTLQDQTPEQAAGNTSILHVDPPIHSRLRRAFGPLFAVRNLRWLIPLIEHRAVELVRSVRDRSRPDVVGDLARPLAESVLCDFMGVAECNRAAFLWALAVSLGDMERNAPDETFTSLQLLPGDGRLSTGSPTDMVLAVLREARRAARTEFWAKLDGPPKCDVDETEVAEFLLVVVAAGCGDAAVSYLATAAEHWFSDWPQYRDRRFRTDGTIDGFTEEVARISSPLMHTRRTASRATALGGCDIPAGSKVVLWLASANFDPKLFPRPLEFDADRSPNRQLSFERGAPHHCLGAPLMRMQLGALLNALAPWDWSGYATEHARRTPGNFVHDVYELHLLQPAIEEGE